MDNAITVIGNLTRAPEQRQSVVSLSLAVNRRWQKNGETQEQTSFFDVTCFGDLGKHVAQSCVKGTRVVVSGRLEQQTWEHEGERKSKVHIVADDVGVSLRFAALGAEDTRDEEAF